MMLGALANPLIRVFEWLYRHPGLRRLMVEAKERFDDRVLVDQQHPPIRLHVASRMEHQRAQGFFSKEADTIAWLDELQADELFVDIGANVGVYTLYAAIRRRAKVLAFEPESQNFAALNRNINANRLMDRVVAYPVALSDTDGPTVLHLSRFASGASHHSVDEPVGEGGREFKAAFRQGTVSKTLDEIIATLSPDAAPRFVKIDVDGAEARVVAGMKALLGRPELEQILIELAPADETEATIFTLLETAGFIAGPPAWEYNGRGNYIFRRATSKDDA